MAVVRDGQIDTQKKCQKLMSEWRPLSVNYLFIWYCIAEHLGKDLRVGYNDPPLRPGYAPIPSMRNNSKYLWNKSTKITPFFVFLVWGRWRELALAPLDCDDWQQYLLFLETCEWHGRTHWCLRVFNHGEVYLVKLSVIEKPTKKVGLKKCIVMFKAVL